MVLKNLCCIRSCAEHDLKQYFEFHEWAYVIALFCMSYFKRSAKQVGERKFCSNLSKLDIYSMLMPFGRNCERSGLYLNLLCSFHLCCLAVFRVGALFFHAPLFTCWCLYNFKVEEWSVFSLTLICNDSFS